MTFRESGKFTDGKEPVKLGHCGNQSLLAHTWKVLSSPSSSFSADRDASPGLSLDLSPEALQQLFNGYRSSPGPDSWSRLLIQPESPNQNHKDFLVQSWLGGSQQ